MPDPYNEGGKHTPCSSCVTCKIVNEIQEKKKKDSIEEREKAAFLAGQKQERERITSEMPKIYVAHEEFLAVCKQIAGDETRTGIEAAIALQKVKNVIVNVLSATEPKS